MDRSPRSRSLLEDVGRATIECAELPALRGEVSLDGASAPRFDDSLAVHHGRWIEGRELVATGGAAIRSVQRDPVEQRDVLFVPAGAGGIHRVVAVPEDEPLVVLARVRAIAKTGARPELTVASLAAAPASDDPRAAFEASRDANAGGASSAPALPKTVAAAQERGEAWQTLALFVPPRSGRRGLRISLAEGVGLLVDRVVVRASTPIERIAAASRAAPSVHPLVADVLGAHAKMSSLLLPSGTRVRFDLDVPPKAPRLDGWLALHPQCAPGDAHLAIRVGEQLLLDRAAPPDASGFAPFSVPLERFAATRITLELAASGPPGAVVTLGDPWLLAGSPRRPGPNVLILSLDTLRRDALGCYGNAQARTPAIDALAKSGSCFTRATSPSSYTLPAHASLFSGQHPLLHGAIDAGYALDPKRSPLLAERLAAAGWQTAAFTGGGFVHPDFGFAQGFSSYVLADPGGVHLMFQREPAPLAADRGRFARIEPVLEWLERRSDQPFLLFVHTYFVHNYVPSDDFADRRGAAHRPELAVGKDLAAILHAIEAHPGVERDLRALYQAAVDEVDARLVAPLLATLDRLGIADDTILVLLSDHGEELHDHGSFLHGHALWRELVDVPLIVRGPGIPTGARRDDPAGLEDVAPTLLARLGLGRDERASGRDLFAARESDEPFPRLLHLDQRDPRGHLRWDGLELDRFTLLRERPLEGDPRELLFDRDADPAQAEDLAARLPEIRNTLARRLDAAILDALDAAGALPGHPLERADREELEERLRELGYVR